MRIGVHATAHDTPRFKAMGFDFLAVDGHALLRPDLTSPAWEAAAGKRADSPLPIELADNLFTHRHPILGPSRNLTTLQDDLQRIAKRAEQLRIALLVFDSGAARRKPDSLDHDSAFEQLAQFLRLAGEICAHHGVTFAIAPLPASETNTVNTLTQARFLCDQVNHPNVALVLDSRFHEPQSESDDDVLELAGRVAHVHLDRPLDAVIGHEDTQHFLCLLRKIGYDGRMTVDPPKSSALADPDAHAALRWLRESWAQCGKSD